MLQAEMSTAKICSLAGGEVVYYTNRSPDKDTRNEDTLAIIPTSESSGVLALADGCGGEVMGKEAAAIAIQAIVESVTKSTNPALVRTAILDGFELATQQVAKLGGGAATTLVVVEINGRQLRTFHVGDSQAMLVGGRGKVKFVTLAHSPVSFAQEAGYLTEDEAIGHEDRNIISNALGAEGTYIDVGLPRTLAVRDTLVMGSDGLYDNLTVGEIVELVRRGSIEKAVDATRQAVEARMSGGQPDSPCKPDDFTVMLFRRSKKIAAAALHERAG
jgi:PPM family protein phosphatase